MTANELMIGSLVKLDFYDTYGADEDEAIWKNGRICSIHGKDLANIDFGDKVEFDVLIEDVKPIPITNNILMKNFPDVNSTDDLRWWPLRDKPGKYMIAVSVSDKDDCSQYIHKYSGICDYVHQLQHILRHLGIDKEIEL